MRKYWLLLPLTVLAIGMYSANAQPPEGDRGQRPQGFQPGGMRGGGGGQQRGERRIDPQVDAWVKILAEKITDPHDEIRDSARVALVAVGPAAMPALRPLMDGNDGAKATAARKVIEAIEHNQRQHAMAMQGVMGMPSASAQGGRGMFGGGGGGDGADARPDQRRPDANPNPPVNNRPGVGGDQPRRPGVGGDQPRGEGQPNADRQGGGNQRGNPMDAILDSLELNDRQRKQAEDILSAHREKMRELHERLITDGGDGEKTREIRDKAQQAMMKEMKKLLGDKFVKFEEGMKKMAPPRPEGGQPRPDRE